MTTEDTFHWQIINGKQPAEQTLLSTKYHITEEVITYALDEDESPTRSWTGRRGLSYSFTMCPGTSRRMTSMTRR